MFCEESLAVRRLGPPACQVRVLLLLRTNALRSRRLMGLDAEPGAAGPASPGYGSWRDRPVGGEVVGRASQKTKHVAQSR